MLKIAEWIGQARSFLLDVQSEAKRVTWLNLRNTLAQTAVALVFVFVVAVYLGLVDLGLSHLINYLLNIRF